MTIVYTIFAGMVLAAIYFGIRYFVRASQKFGGERVIICPETGKQAMVELDVRRAAISSLIGQTDLRLENCLVRSVLEKWYRDKACTFCERPFEKIELIDHRPALLNPEGVTVEWKQ